MRLIDAESVLYALVEEGQDNATKYGFHIGDTIKFTPTQVDEIVSRMPTIELERKKGKWINCDGGIATCSVCGDRWGVYGVMNFCPNCGAEMKGDKDEDKNS